MKRALARTMLVALTAAGIATVSAPAAHAECYWITTWHEVCLAQS